MHNKLIQYPAASAKDMHEACHQQMVVFVVDRDEAARASVATLVDRNGWRTECYSTAQGFLERTAHAGPNCVVLDVDLPDAAGLALQQRIAAERSATPVIAVAGKADVRSAVQAMKAGAVDFLTKPVFGPSLLHAIDQALAWSRAAIDHARSVHAIQARHDTLSPREQEVVSLVVRGLLNKQVGAELGISEITVKAHRGSAMRKMGARSLPELVNMVGRLQEPAPAAA